MTYFNYFLIYTEHHLKQVNNAIKHYALNHDSVVIFIFKSFRKESGNFNWINELKKGNNFAAIYVNNQWSSFTLFNNHKIDASNYRSQLKLHSKSKNKRLFTSIYKSDTVQLANKILKAEIFYVMDEGSASYSVAVERKKKKYFSWLLIFSSFLHKRSIFKLPRSIIYFTKYNDLPVINNDSIDNYTIDVKKNSIILDNNSLILLGSTIYKSRPRMKSIIDSSYYISILNCIINNYPNKKKYYYGHRYEDNKSLKSFEDLGFNIILNQEPFEELFQNLKPCPATFLSFGSPILDNLTREYEETPNLIIIKPDLSRYRIGGEYFSLIFNNFSLNPKLTVWEIDQDINNLNNP